MGHFEGRGDTQIYVGDDGKVYDSPLEKTVLADSADAYFGGNGNKPDMPKPKPTTKKTKQPAKKKATHPRKLRKDRFEMVNCPVCGKAVKKGAGLSNHMRMAHPEEE